MGVRYANSGVFQQSLAVTPTKAATKKSGKAAPPPAKPARSTDKGGQDKKEPGDKKKGRKVTSVQL